MTAGSWRRFERAIGGARAGVPSGSGTPPIRSPPPAVLGDDHRNSEHADEDAQHHPCHSTSDRLVAKRSAPEEDGRHDEQEGTDDSEQRLALDEERREPQSDDHSDVDESEEHAEQESVEPPVISGNVRPGVGDEHLVVRAGDECIGDPDRGASGEGLREDAEAPTTPACSFDDRCRCSSPHARRLGDGHGNDR